VNSQPWINIKDFGANGDTKKVSDGKIDAGTDMLGSATANYISEPAELSITYL
jgi:hypothetical protein